jgi:hypothetical protein
MVWTSTAHRRRIRGLIFNDFDTVMLVSLVRSNVISSERVTRLVVRSP